jgi:UDP-N-acetylmuramate dehydrogenase
MKTAVRDRFLQRLSCPITADEPLAHHTTFCIGGRAAIFARPRSIQELITVQHVVQNENVSCFYLGLGSNILISDDGFDGVVIQASGDLCCIEKKAEMICAGPGARLLDLTAFAATHGLSGMERLSGIPGSVGGGLYMNAGAYGAEICDTFVEADVLDAIGQVRTISRQAVHFDYRSAPEFQNVIVLESRYVLTPDEPRKIYTEMRHVWKLRRAKQPLDLPSAGSIFKRPPGDFAGRLIEAVHGKGERVGGAMVSPKHAGIFVNTGGATAQDVAALIREIRCRVYETFGILLEPEVKAVGFKDDPFAIAL